MERGLGDFKCNKSAKVPVWEFHVALLHWHLTLFSGVMEAGINGHLRRSLLQKTLFFPICSFQHNTYQASGLIKHFNTVLNLNVFFSLTRSRVKLKSHKC